MLARNDTTWPAPYTRAVHNLGHILTKNAAISDKNVGTIETTVP